MKNLISYKKSGLNALRKALSLFVVLCTVFQTSFAQEMYVDGWYNTYSPVDHPGKDEVSRVASIDECGMLYRVTILKEDPSKVGEFVIKYRGSDIDLNDVVSEIPSSEFTCENDKDGKPRCKFSVKSNDDPYVFYLNTAAEKVTVTKTEPVKVDAVKISTSQSTKANVGSTISFASKLCLTGDVKSYDWKVSTDNVTWISPEEGNGKQTFDFTVLSDVKYVRCEVEYDNGSIKTVKSNVITLSPSKASFNIDVIAEGARYINAIEREVPSWRDVVIKVADYPSSKILSSKISYKSFDEDASYSAMTDKEAKFDAENTAWTIYSDKSGWIKVELEVEVPALDGTTVKEKIAKEILFRVVYSPDKEDATQMLFEDDFGYFQGNEYHYVKYKNGAVDDEDAVEPLNASLPSNVKWMKDMNGFIPGKTSGGHDFALDDPRTVSLPVVDGKVDRSGCTWGNSDPYQCWCENGFRVEDSYYAFVSDPAMAEGGGKTNGDPNDYWSGSDHTGNTDGTKHGAMLMVNCNPESQGVVIYERPFQIAGECSNVMVLFSAFVSNAQSRAEGGMPVNIRMDIYDEDGVTLLKSIESGDVVTRNYAANSWSNLTALFPLSKGNSDSPKKYVLKITNNMEGNNGNDILLDDISLQVCFPEIEVKAEVESNERFGEDTVVICGKQRTLTLTAFNRAGIENYIPSPSYLFQYYDEDSKVWMNLPKGMSNENAITSDPTREIELSNTGFNGDTKFRVIVGNDATTIEKVIDETIKNPDCKFTYAVSRDFHVKFNPLGADLDLFGCIGETININADANGRPTIEWQDYAGNVLALNDSIKSISGDKVEFVIPESILTSNNKSDTLYMLATTVGGLCTDTQIVAITKYDDLDFKFDNDTFYCEFGGNINAVDVYPTSGISYVWKLKDSDLADQTGSTFEVKKSSPEIFDNTVTVTGTATGYCPITKSTDFSIYRRYSLELTVDVEGNPEKVANVCLPTDGENSSRVDLTVKKIFADNPAPSYANEKVTTYFWYRKDGNNDSTLIGQGSDTKFVDRLTENNVYKYSVTALDSVCYKNDGVATSDSTIINARKPLVVEISEDKAELCKGDAVTLTIEITNALKVDTITSLLFENDAYLTSLKGASRRTETYIPENKTTKKETKNIRVEVMDKICSPSKPVTDEVSFDVFVPLKVSLTTDADQGGVQKCIRKENNDDFVNATLTIEEGDYRSIQWFDGLHSDMLQRPVTVSHGENTIWVKAYDNVCRTSAEASVLGADDTITVIASEPLIVKLDASKEDLCNGDTIEFKLKTSNILANTSYNVRWYENGVQDPLVASTPNITRVHIPSNATNFVEKKTMVVKIDDKVCNGGNDVMDSVSYNVLIPIKLTLEHNAVVNGSTLQKCIAVPNVDNVVDLEVKVVAGNPSKLTWSDGKYNDDLVFKREFVVSPGKNPISVVGSDGVCPASANDNDDLNIVAGSPITLSITPKNPDVCDGSDVAFDLVVTNSLTPNNVSVRWYEDATLLYTSYNADTTQNHTSSNSTMAKLVKTMVVKTDDEICSKGTEIVASADYTVYKPVKFNLTSDAIEFNISNRKCLGQTSHGSQTSADVTVNLTQGNPTKFVWSDDIIWEWKWTDGYVNQRVRTFNLEQGTNTLSVVAYDEVCNKEGAAGQFEGEGQNIEIEARKPISVDLKLVEGHTPMCKGEEIKLEAIVENPMPGERTNLMWNENHGVENGLMENGSYETDLFAPEVGPSSYSIQASEDSDTPICPAQSAFLSVSTQVNTTLSVSADKYNICQDTTGKDTLAYVVLTAKVLTGDPTGVIWNTGDTTKLKAGISRLKVNPMENTVYSVYGYDKVCKKTTPAKAKAISVDHRIYLTMSAEDYNVQMGDTVRLHAETSIPYKGSYTWNLLAPEENELATTKKPKYNVYVEGNAPYEFEVTINNGNCGYRTAESITVDVADYVVVPNVITPYNGNPKNDKFMEGYDVTIFNRYQETVYEGNDGWDATYRGELATPGTYFYIVRKKDGRVLKGTVEVYRK
ncbi:MAG: gliding motility-associated C-terminal domain-containing protein [Paludibacteraceae bacterium]|nr:gliding motility-associated C-terminal domain-containing protein [Paludibacteraceae bacterium]